VGGDDPRGSSPPRGKSNKKGSVCARSQLGGGWRLSFVPIAYTECAGLLMAKDYEAAECEFEINRTSYGAVNFPIVVRLF